MRLTNTQAQLLEQLSALPLLSPHDFVARWTLSYHQISQICYCSTSTVEHWFTTGAGQRSPSASYQKLLAIADFLLTNSEAIDYLWQFRS
jgi:hypothetical protein